MTLARGIALILAVALAAAVALVLFEGARTTLARYASASWVLLAALAILVGLGAWATLRLPRSPRRSSTPPGVQWFPTGTWWGHHRRHDNPRSRRRD